MIVFLLAYIILTVYLSFWVMKDNSKEVENGDEKEINVNINPCRNAEKGAIYCILYSWGVLLYYNLNGHDISGYIIYAFLLLPAWFISFCIGVKFLFSRKYHRYVLQNGLILSRVLLLVALWVTIFLTAYLLNEKLF